MGDEVAVAQKRNKQGQLLYCWYRNDGHGWWLVKSEVTRAEFLRLLPSIGEKHEQRLTPLLEGYESDTYEWISGDWRVKGGDNV